MLPSSLKVPLCLALLFAVGCKRQLVEQPVEPLEKPSTALTQTKIGDVKPNVFSHPVVQKVLNGLLSSKEGVIGNAIVQQAVVDPTHLYVRFAPQNEEQLLRLEEAGIVLYDVPLNVDIVTEGDWYQDPSIPADQITYQYSLIPDGYPLPTDIPYIVMDVIYLYNEDDGEAQEPDPWAGGGNCDQFNATGAGVGVPIDCIPQAPPPGPQHQSAGKLMPMSQFYSRKKDGVIRATNEIKKLGIKPSDLYAAVAKHVKFDPEAYDEGLVQNGSRRYYPKGTLTAHNTELNAGVPLYGIQVRSRNFLKLGTAFTNKNGWFEIFKGYRKRAWMKAVCRNPTASVRSLHTWMKPWLSVLSVEHNLGQYRELDLENIAFNFERNPSAGTHTSRKWAAFTALSTLTDAYWWNGRDDFDYNFPYVKMLLTDSYTEPGITPMSSFLIKEQTGATEVAAVFDWLKDLLKEETKKTVNDPTNGYLLKAALTAILPDMVYAFGGADGLTTLTSRQLQNGVFRSAGRATHYYSLFKKVSPTGPTASNYWWATLKRMLSYRLSSAPNSNPPFGFKNNEGAQQLAIIEAWAHYYGNMRNSERYRTGVFNTAIGRTISDAEIGEIENQRPRNNIALNVFGTGTNTWYEGWIPCGLLHDVGDMGENTAFTNITDNATQYGMLSIYKTIISDTHTSVPFFINTLLSRSLFAQEAQVRSLQQQYGY